MRHLISAFTLLFSLNVHATELKTYCKPSQSCWPEKQAWDQLNKDVNGRLIAPGSFIQPCQIDPDSTQCKAVLQQISNPFALEEQSGATQSTGWLNAWDSTASNYVIAAQTAEDIARGINFARDHNIKIAIKGTGHDYLGRSNSPDSLLIWTHHMRGVTLNDNFIPQGCPSSEKGMPVATVLAGTRWLEVYGNVIVKNGRYVQGGGCNSVGAAGGFLQGGGFGSFSKKFGLGAAGLVEAEVVTADGQILTANACQNSDLFWALRGGGGGTFGVVTKVTLKTHDLPENFGIMTGTIKASSDQNYQNLLTDFLHFYRDHLNNEHWGEKISLKPNNTLEIFLAFQGLTQEEAEQTWKPFEKLIAQKGNSIKMDYKIITIPAQHLWDYDYISKNYPDFMVKGGNDNGTQYWWWKGDGAQVSHYWYTYQSRWVPSHLFSVGNTHRLANLLFDASRFWDVELHLNKGLAGGSEEALKTARLTSMNPASTKAPLLVVMGAGESPAFSTIKGMTPHKIKGETAARKINAAMTIIREATPGAGAYGNEADYFESHWQEALWGENYSLLLEIKHKYDPENVFTCHHCVGSEHVAK